MGGDERIDGGPRSAIVVGAGIVGLSTAWFLQERGVEVTVVDGCGVATGASWGNAGWVAPALTLPLNSPAVLRYGLRSLRDRSAPLHIPLSADRALWRFLAPIRRQLPSVRRGTARCRPTCRSTRSASRPSTSSSPTGSTRR